MKNLQNNQKCLTNLLKRNQLTLFRVDNLSVHGGSNRIYASKKKSINVMRSVLDNLLAPFLDVKNKSFRERVWVDASIQNQWINHFSNIFDPGKWVPQTK